MMSWWCHQILTRVETGKIWKSSWNSVFCSYQVTHSVLCFPPFIYHPPWEKALNWDILRSQHAQLTTSTSYSSPKLTISKDHNMQPPFWSCRLSLVVDDYPKGDNSSLKNINFNIDSFVKQIVRRGQLAMLSPNLALFLSVAFSFTVNLAPFFKILDTISNQEDKLSAKYSTSSLNIFQVCKVPLVFWDLWANKF